MAKTTGIVLATGAITLGNQVLFDPGTEVELKNAMKVVMATGFAAGMFTLVENASPDVAVALAWTAFVTVMLSPIDANRSPVQRALDWWNENYGRT